MHHCHHHSPFTTTYITVTSRRDDVKPHEVNVGDDRGSFSAALTALLLALVETHFGRVGVLVVVVVVASGLLGLGS